MFGTKPGERGYHAPSLGCVDPAEEYYSRKVQFMAEQIPDDITVNNPDAGLGEQERTDGPDPSQTMRNIRHWLPRHNSMNRRGGGRQRDSQGQFAYGGGSMEPMEEPQFLPEEYRPYMRRSRYNAYAQQGNQGGGGQGSGQSGGQGQGGGQSGGQGAGGGQSGGGGASAYGNYEYGWPEPPMVANHMHRRPMFPIPIEREPYRFTYREPFRESPHILGNPGTTFHDTGNPNNHTTVHHVHETIGGEPIMNGQLPGGEVNTMFGNPYSIPAYPASLAVNGGGFGGFGFGGGGFVGTPYGVGVEGLAELVQSNQISDTRGDIASVGLHNSDQINNLTAAMLIASKQDAITALTAAYDAKFTAMEQSKDNAVALERLTRETQVSMLALESRMIDRIACEGKETRELINSNEKLRLTTELEDAKRANAFLHFRLHQPVVTVPPVTTPVTH